MPLADGGTSRRTAFVFSSAVESVAAGASSPVQPRVGPVTGVRINDNPADQYVSGVGTTPTVSFQPPALGSPTYYVIVPFEVIVSSSGTTLLSRGSVGVIYTKQTEITVPPSLLQAGKHYFLRITAIWEPDTDIATAPFRGGLPYASTQMVTSIFTP